jgi:hypothetical protein
MTIQSIKNDLEKKVKLLKYDIRIEVWQSSSDYTINFTSSKSNRSFCHVDIYFIQWMATGYIYGLIDGQT